MKPAPFDYSAPRALEEALQELDRGGDDAKVLAGGQSLVPLMNFRLAQFDLLVDLNRVDGLDYVREVNGALAIGAIARARDVELSSLAAIHVPLVPKALRFVGHPQIRNRGTVCGSIAHADPSAEMPAVAIALEASMFVRSVDGDRVVPASAFFVTHLTTCLAANEVLAEVRFPLAAARTGTAFVEHARRHGDFAIVAAAAVVELDAHEACTRARLALSGVGDRPFDASEAASALIGRAVTEPEATEIGETVASSVDPTDDIHASARYRRRMAGVLTRRALLSAAADARGAYIT
jgi:aerobic carbon-monoxide dehydrogenase medium subunit